MTERDEFTPEEREADVEIYNAAPPTMPPSPAGADVEIGGEAAASRRLAGLPPGLAEKPLHRSGRATPGSEPILGYDGMDIDDVLDWIREADPEVHRLHAILDYENRYRKREPILEDCRQRILRLSGSPES